MTGKTHSYAKLCLCFALRYSCDVVDQVEMNRRREAEVQKLQRDLEDAQSQNEAQLLTFRKKHQEAVNQLTEQMDQLHKLKQKYAHRHHAQF